MLCVFVRTDDVTFFYACSQICEELDRPRTGEEDEKSEDIKENDKDAAEKRKMRGEISQIWFLHHRQELYLDVFAQNYKVL